MDTTHQITGFVGSLASAPAHVRTLLQHRAEQRDEAIVVYVPVGGVYAAIEPLVLPEHSSLIVHVEDGAQADVAVWLQGASTAHTADVMVGNAAHCTLTTINVGCGEKMSITQRGSVGSDSVLRWQNITLGTAPLTHDLQSTVTGHNGESAVDWMFYAKGTEHQTLSVRNIFQASNGRGEILMRGVAEEKGHAECRGLIDIGLHGGGTNTYLTQEVLMLDASSKIDAVPSLEIKTNDVKASHSATVARVTEEDLFYFGARGIAPQEARRMFVIGFLGDITGRVLSPVLRERIVRAIEEKYEQKTQETGHNL